MLSKQYTYLNAESHTYMCTSEKDGRITDITMMRGLASARVYCAIHRQEGCVCKVQDIRTNERVSLTDGERRTPQRKWAKGVRCRETGEVWKTVSDFQKHTGLKRWALETKIRNNTPIGGKTYEFVNEQIEINGKQY